MHDVTLTSSCLQTNLVDSLGANPIESLAKFGNLTYFVTVDDKDEMSRSMKLIMAITYGTRLVTASWAKDSSKAGKFLPPTKYNSANKALETKFGFSLKAAIDNARHLRKVGGLLAAFFIYICPGVVALKSSEPGKPPADELKLLLEANGANILSTQRSIAIHDANEVLLITSHPNPAFTSPALKKAEKGGVRVVPLADLFAAITQQCTGPIGIQAAHDARTPLGASYTNQATTAQARDKLPFKKEQDQSKLSAPSKAPAKAPAASSQASAHVKAAIERKPTNQKPSLKIETPASVSKKLRSMPRKGSAEAHSASGKIRSSKSSKSSKSKAPAPADVPVAAKGDTTNPKPASKIETPAPPSGKKVRDTSKEDSQAPNNFTTPAKAKPALSPSSVFNKYGFTFDRELGQVTSVRDAAEFPDDPAPEQGEHDPFKTPKKGTADGAETVMDVIHKIKLSIPPARTTSSGRDNRQSLGQGDLYIFKSSRDGKLNVQFIDTDGVKMFDSVLPHKSILFDYVKGNAGMEHVFYWNANNKAHAAGGTTIKGATAEAVGHRRYYFWFEDRSELDVTLYFLFCRDMGLVKEFFKQDGRFTQNKESLPAHAIVVDEDEMDTVAFGTEADKAPEEDSDAEGYDPCWESQPY